MTTILTAAVIAFVIETIGIQDRYCRRVTISRSSWEQAIRDVQPYCKSRRNRGYECERAFGIEYGSEDDSGMPNNRPAKGIIPDVIKYDGTHVEVKSLKASVCEGFGLCWWIAYILAGGLKSYAYIVHDGDAYEMDPATFLEFLVAFPSKDKDTSTGKVKTRLKLNQKMVQWLEDRRTA